MKFFRKLLEWLTSKPKQSARKWDPNTNPIDVQKLAKNLRLKEEGARLGMAGVPLDDDFSLCAPETHALLAIEQARTDYIEWGLLRLKSLNTELSRLDITPALATVAESADEFERIANGDITANESTIKQHEALASSRQQAFERFRKEHCRLDLPHYPEGIPKAFAWVFAVFLIVVEALANASFFAKGLAGGWLGGFTEASIASSLNVLVCLAAGSTVVRYVGHVKIIPRLLGIVATAVTGVFICALALLVAHYREALVLGLDSAQSVAIETFLLAPFALKEVSSWYLFLVGVGFGVLALVDGYKMDDPYPGYGKRHRRAVSAAVTYANGLGELHEHLSGLKKQMLDKIDEVQSRSAASIAQVKNVISDKDRCRDGLVNIVKDSPAMLNVLLAEFRTENIVSRKANGHGTPSSFEVLPALRELELPSFDTSADRESLARQEAMLADFMIKAPAMRARIQTGFNTHFNSLHTLKSHFGGSNAGGTPKTPDLDDSMPSVATAMQGAR